MSDKHDAQGELPPPILRRKAGIGAELVDFYSAEQVQGIIAKIRATEGQAQTSAAAPLTSSQIFDIAHPYFVWTLDDVRCDGWQKATHGVIGMPNLLALAKALTDAAQLADSPVAQTSADRGEWNCAISEIAEELEAKSNLGIISQFTALCIEFDRLRDAAQLAESTAHGAPVDGINGPMTDAQKQEARHLYRNLHHLGPEAMEDVVRFASVCGYVNGRKDFAEPAAPTAQQSLTGGAVPEGYLIAPHYRGYADLGTGQYVLNHSGDGEAAELIISVATDEQKAGRTVGERRINKPDALLDPDVMAVRIRFSSAAGLDALEVQLRDLRGAHFPDAAAPLPQVQSALDLSGVSSNRLELELTLRGGPHFQCQSPDCKSYHNAPGKWDSCPSCGRKGYLCGSFPQDRVSAQYKAWEQRVTDRYLATDHQPVTPSGALADNDGGVKS